MAQLVKNLLAMWEIWVQSLGWEDLLEKGKSTHSSILAWRISWTIVHGVTKRQTGLSNFHFHFLFHFLLLGILVENFCFSVKIFRFCSHIDLKVNAFLLSGTYCVCPPRLWSWDFSTDPVVKNQPANAGDMGWISGLGIFHMPQATRAHVPQSPSLHALGPASPN